VRGKGEGSIEIGTGLCLEVREGMQQMRGSETFRSYDASIRHGCERLERPDISNSTMD
jgi:hypothetical protein